MSDGAVWRKVPRPQALGGGRYRPAWNSVALFFNLRTADQPSGYEKTTTASARAWLDEGGAPAQPGISEFMANYWGTVSYGRLAFGVTTPKRDGRPIIPTLALSDSDADDFRALIERWVRRRPADVWQAAGSLEVEGTRYIPSVVLVHRYLGGAWADEGWTERISGETYEVARITHMEYGLTFVGDDPRVDPPDVPPHRARVFWQTLAHEYAHNFLDEGDLYGPSGCTGYWDLLGDNNVAGRMSEISAVHKVAIGWRRFRRVVNGPGVAEQELSLRPYTTTGDAIKVVPDPYGNPHEYFVLEYRRRTGDALWIPDRGLTERGLFITHLNDRLHIPPTWRTRTSPYFDPEYADFSDQGTTGWEGWDQLDGALFTGARGRDRFTPTSRPSSAFYGPRPSGLHITDIRISDERVTFRLRIDGRAPSRGAVTARIGSWLTSETDRAVAGRFTIGAGLDGLQVAMRNDRSVALLRLGEGQLLVHARQHLDAGGWSLTTRQTHRAADLDGDGLDELFVRTLAGPRRVAVLKWGDRGFAPIAVAERRVGAWDLPAGGFALPVRFDGRRHRIVHFADHRAAVIQLNGTTLSTVVIHDERIDGWNLNGTDARSAGRFTQPKVDEIVVRSDDWLGLLTWDARARRLRARSVQADRIDGWNLGAGDHHVVGDFDGDGRDEIFIRSARWAGLLGWAGDRFAVRWIAEATIPHWLGDDRPRGQPAALTLATGDRHYTGRLFPDRDVVHRAGSALSILSWEDGAMQLRLQRPSPFHGRWTLADEDRLIVGELRGRGPDPNNTDLDYIQDGLDDVLLHNARGTALLGATWIPDRDDPTKVVEDQFDLTWVSGRTLLPAR